MQYKWAYQTMIDDYDLHLLYNAMRGHQDSYEYYPLAVAKREEIGSSWRFLCIAIPKSNQEYASHLAVIGVYKPPQGIPYATCLHRHDFDQLFP